MKKLLLIAFVLVQLVGKAEYDGAYVLSITQKYAILENVSNGDDVGTCRKTYPWASVGTISYSIEQNYNNAFPSHSSSGLITISDASKINGKVVQQDTLISLIIRTIDSGEGLSVSMTSDIEGTSVPQGGSPDIGAYEYTGGTTSSISVQMNQQKGISIYPNPTTGRELVNCK